MATSAPGDRLAHYSEVFEKDTHGHNITLMRTAIGFLIILWGLSLFFGEAMSTLETAVIALLESFTATMHLATATTALR